MRSAPGSRTTAPHRAEDDYPSGMKVHQPTNLTSAVFSLNSEAL